MQINLAFSDDKNFSDSSGYSVLGQYITEAQNFHVKRKPEQVFQKVINRLLRLNSISNWYQLSSANLEFKLWQQSNKKTNSITHLLWGERDLGYLDLLVNLNQQIVCCTFHGCADELPQIIIKPRRLSKLNGIILMSESQRDFFESHGVATSKIQTIYHGIDINFFKPAPEKLSHSKKKFRVLSVGNYRRNFPLLQEICIALQAYQEIEFYLITADKNHHFFQGLENVTCLNRLSREQLLEMYQTADCQLLCMENATANNALLEGLACGLPIIAESIGGTPEYTNQACADLAQPNDVKALVQSILALSKSPMRQMEMSKEARIFALDLAWDKVAQRTLAFYQKIHSSSVL